MPRLQEVKNIPVARKRLLELDTPEDVSFSGLLEKDGKPYILMSLPRWYRHPDEYPKLDEVQYQSIQRFEDKFFEILFQCGLDDIDIHA
jgi:hypothetical protein